MKSPNPPQRTFPQSEVMSKGSSGRLTTTLVISGFSANASVIIAIYPPQPHSEEPPSVVLFPTDSQSFTSPIYPTTTLPSSPAKIVGKPVSVTVGAATIIGSDQVCP